MNNNTLRIAAMAALAAGMVALAPVAHADQSTIDAAVHDSWETTCHALGHGFTGTPATDAPVLMGAIHVLENLYAMDPHDAAAATGEIIGQHCPQYKPNVAAVYTYAQKVADES